MCAKSGYVEAYIQREKEKIWDAYLSIDVRKKSGDEKILSDFHTYLNHTTQYLGLMDYFENCSESEVWITDNMIELQDMHDVWCVMHAIYEKNILVHLCVSEDKIENIKTHLDELVEARSAEDDLALQWTYADDGYMLQLVKRIPNGSRYILRLYEDGNGVVVFLGRKDYRTAYFRIPKGINNTISNAVTAKIEDIVRHPRPVTEDDRYFGYPFHMQYGLLWKYPNAEKNLLEGDVYENLEYANQESEIELAKQLLEISEIKDIWMRIHGDHVQSNVS